VSGGFGSVLKNKRDLSTWSYRELLEEERRWGKHAMQAEEIRFEIDRRHRSYKLWALGIGAVGAIIVAVFTVLNHFSK